MKLPDSIHNKVANKFDNEILDVAPVHGGDINQAGKIKLRNGSRYFIKWNENSPPNMFQTEANGLNLLQSAGTDLEIPATHIVNEQFLVLDWIEEKDRIQNNAAFEFGKELAKLHQKSDNQFGLSFDNYIGKLPQSNFKHSNWFDFFAIERIEPQIKLGVESGKLNRIVLRQAESLYKKLGHIFPVEAPALLHGDLWSGNYMITRNNKGSIFDPAVYFGYREMDLSMTKLFGGFPADFYNGYEENFPLEPGFDSRVPLYNLYPVLVHANLFGGSYCRQAEEIISRFA